MRRNDGTPGGVFQPDDLRVIARAYEDTVSILRVEPGPFCAVSEERREALVADAILEAARNSHGDAKRLAQAAFSKLASTPMHLLREGE
jgi:hypothetical protein